MNKTKVLVFTQTGKWINLVELAKKMKEKRETWIDKYPNKDKPISKFGFSNDTGAYLDEIDINGISNEEGIFLVYDNIDNDRFETLKEQCDGDKVFVLTHTTGTCQRSSFNDWSMNPFVLSGSHTNEKTDFYNPLFDILTDQDGDKMERILNTIFMPQSNLETVLRFLHLCLDPNLGAEFTKLKSDILEKLPDKSEAKEALTSYPKQTSLEELRDLLLDFALNQN